MVTSQSRVLLVFTCIFMTSSVTSYDATWKPSKWLNDLEPSNFVKVEEMNSALAKQKQEMLEEFMKFNEKQKPEDTKITDKITVLERKITDLQNQNLVIFNLTTMYLKYEVKSKSDADNLKQISENIAAKHEEFDLIHKEIEGKHEKYDILHEQIKNQFESKHQQILQNVQALTEIENSNTLEVKKALEMFKNETNKAMRDNKVEVLDMIDKLKQDLIVIKTTTLENDKKIGGLQKSERTIKTGLNKTFTNEIEMIKLGDNFYHFSNSTLNWHDAQKFCHSHGFELAALETEKEAKLIQTYWNDNIKPDKPMWLDGKRDDTSKGNWHWNSTGSDVTYTGWNDHSNVASDENCMMLRYISNNSGAWGSYKCDTKWRFICEV